MGKWLDMLRASYNWYLRDRIDGYEQQFRYGDYCDIKAKVEISPLTCSIVKGTLLDNPWKDNGGVNKKGKKVSPKKSVTDMQITSLPELKDARAWYRDIYSQVLQQNIKRLEDAFDRFFKGQNKYPNFKNRSNFRSFAYPQGVRFKGAKVYLPGIGWMRFFNSRLLPDGFQVKTATVRKKADGWYISVRIEDKTVPDFPTKPLAEAVGLSGRTRSPTADLVSTAVGLDMGITKLVHCSDGSDVDNPKFGNNKKIRQLLKIRQRRVNRKKKGSKNRAKAGKRVAKLHQKVADQRSAYQWRVANRIVKKADCIVVEDLNIPGMKSRCKPSQDEKGRFLTNGQAAKRGLNRAISDATWGDLISKIEYVAAKSGKVLVKVNPKHTSQTCSACGHVDKSSRDREKFICTSCGHIAHADKQAARNIKARAVEQYGLQIKKFRKVRGDCPEPPKEPIQLTIWGTPSESCVSPKEA
jgi:putative transposase